MGFPGCALRTAAIVAVVFGCVQSIIGISLGAVISFRFDEKPMTIRTKSPLSDRYIEFTYKSTVFATCKAIAEAHIAFNVLWLVSSMILVIAITKSHPWLHRQWTIVTSCVLVSDVVLFIIACIEVKRLYDPAYDTFNFYNLHMILLLCALSRYGIIGLVCNICLAVLVVKRAAEIISGPQQTTGYVIASAGQHGIPLMQSGPTMIIQGQPMYVQPGHPGQQAYPTPNNQQQPPAYNPEYKDGGSELVKK